MGYFMFLKKTEIVLITSFTILLNYAVSTLPLSNYFYFIYQYSQDSMAYTSRHMTINSWDF